MSKGLEQQEGKFTNILNPASRIFHFPSQDVMFCDIAEEQILFTGLVSTLSTTSASSIAFPAEKEKEHMLWSPTSMLTHW